MSAARRENGHRLRARGRRAGRDKHAGRSGITGILNFAPIVLAVPEDVMVNNVNLAIELENLSYFIRELTRILICAGGNVIGWRILPPEGQDIPPPDRGFRRGVGVMSLGNHLEDFRALVAIQPLAQFRRDDFIRTRNDDQDRAAIIFQPGRRIKPAPQQIIGRNNGTWFWASAASLL